MATIKYFTKGGETSTIYIRLYKGKEIDYKRSTHYRVLNKHWDSKREQIKNVAVAFDRDSINSSLLDLKVHIGKEFNSDYAKGTIINGDWLESKIKEHFGQKDNTDLSLLKNYCEYFISNLSSKKNSAKGGQLGVSESTVKKYKTVTKKLNAFADYSKSTFQLTDIDLKFERSLIKYLKEKEKLSDNYIGRLITFVKTICIDARESGIKTHPQLDKIKGFRKEAKFITLNEEEIEKIRNYDFSKTPYLDNARDWLIVGLHTGQRVSDFMAFTPDTIKGEYLEFKQVKTGAKTIVPLHQYLNEILVKHQGNFPRRITEQRFNDYIKIVCEKAGLTQLVEGTLMNKKTKRKEEGIYAKYKLVSSHICRRSFATNHYGKLPTPVIMNITNHGSEKMFLTYIGKTPKDNAEILRNYWNEIGL